MLTSTFVIFGGANGAEMSTNTKAYGDAGKILYVYGSNKTLANEWRGYLTNLNYAVDLLPQNGLMDAEYYNYNLVIIGTDADSILYQEVFNMYRSDIPIIGIGGGGGRFAPILKMTTHFYYSGSYTNSISASNLFVYSTPNTISGVPGNIQLYNAPGSDIYLLSKSERNLNETLFFGNWTGNSMYSPIAQINNYLFYGYTISPTELTSSGNALLENIIYYMDKQHGYNVYIPRMLSRITMDGEYSYLFEWYGAHFINLDDTWNNYTAIFEDESYIYLYLQVLNTSSSDYLTVHFENNNSRSTSKQESTFYVMLAESWSGVKYRDVDSSGSWSSFKDPDGVNIIAAWVFGLQYCTAEVKILKSYMGLNKNGDNLLGFGMQYTDVINYPSTFVYYNPSTYITAYSQNHWNGQYEEISTPASYIYPIVDGMYTSSEWNGASQYFIQDSNGNSIFVRSTADSPYLYLGGYISNVSGITESLYFYFDPEGNGGSSPQTDDIRFWFTKSGSNSFEYYEEHGTGTGWSSPISPENATMKMTMRGNYVYYEMKIPYNVLGINIGTFKDIHMRVRSEIGSSYYEIPYGSSYTMPDEWTLLLTSPSAWGSDYMTFDAHNGTVVTVDGTMSPGEWDDAFYYSYPVSVTTKHLSMYTKTVDQKMYILLYYPNPSSSDTYIDLAFDVNYDHDGALKNGDFAIRVEFTGGSMEWYASGGNWVSTTPSGWIYAMDKSSHNWTVEIMINFAKLNIVPGEEKDIGVIVYLQDYGSGKQNEPVFGDWYNTSTWNRITSSDNWGGSTVVPEFNTELIAVMFIAIFAVITTLVKKRR